MCTRVGGGEQASGDESDRLPSSSPYPHSFCRNVHLGCVSMACQIQISHAVLERPRFDQASTPHQFAPLPPLSVWLVAGTLDCPHSDGARGLRLARAPNTLSSTFAMSRVSWCGCPLPHMLCSLCFTCVLRPSITHCAPLAKQGSPHDRDGQWLTCAISRCSTPQHIALHVHCRPLRMRTSRLACTTMATAHFTSMTGES